MTLILSTTTDHTHAAAAAARARMLFLTSVPDLQRSQGEIYRTEFAVLSLPYNKLLYITDYKSAFVSL